LVEGAGNNKTKRKRAVSRSCHKELGCIFFNFSKPTQVPAGLGASVLKLGTVELVRRLIGISKK
jgi:hypothetical protein